jgi:hypothetical protein
MAYPFTSGFDYTNTGDPAWDASVIPTLSDASDLSFLHFDPDDAEGHATLQLVGDPAALPADSATVGSISFSLRAHSESVGDVPRSLRVGIHTAAVGAAAMVYSAIEPGWVVPSGSSWFTMTALLDEELMAGAVSIDASEWYTIGAGATWTTLAEFVTALRTSGGFNVLLEQDLGAGPWEIAEASLTFGTAVADGDDTTWTLVLAPIAADELGPAVSTTICPMADADPYDPVEGMVVLPIPTVPDPPELVTLTAGDSGVAAVWTAPEHDGGSPVTGYQVEATSVLDTVLVLSSDAAQLGATVGPLANSTEYSVVVRAVNDVGTSLNSNALSTTPEFGLPPIAPPPEKHGTPLPEAVPVPPLYAFPPQYLFRPSNWLLTPAEAAAQEAAERAMKGETSG